ncbi:hypothetical protein [Streptomyces sp. NPDC058751]|uniref:hypothetical protein n=1 Tax=Streptomyces sp. NPDC058751 TaxID=3346623 RepID=UPI0036A6F851
MMDQGKERFDESELSLGELIREADALVPPAGDNNLQHRRAELIAWMTADADEADHMEATPQGAAATTTAPFDEATGAVVPAEAEETLVLIRHDGSRSDDAPQNSVPNLRVWFGWRFATAAVAAVVGFMTIVAMPSAEPPPLRPAVTPTTPAAPIPPPPVTRGTGHWIVQLASIPKTDGRAAGVQALNALRPRIPTAELIDSDRFASLRPGYWVVIDSGPYTSGADAVAFCHRSGLTHRHDCRGRYLSGNAADANRVCEPDSSSPPRSCRKENDGEN